MYENSTVLPIFVANLENKTSMCDNEDDSQSRDEMLKLSVIIKMVRTWQ
jgi:hypothetical protein